MNKYKESLACSTPFRSLEEALTGADVFIGVSAAGALKPNVLA